MSISDFLKNAIATKVARWQTDASSNVTGLVGPDGHVIRNRSGYRTVLFGDSMTDYNFAITTPTSVAYDPAVNTLTITRSGHVLPVGATFGLWNRGYSSLYGKKYLSVLSVTSTSVFVCRLPDGDYSDLPNSNLAGTTYYVPDTVGSSRGWVTWLNALLGQRFEIVANCAQSGDLTLDARNRVNEALAHDPEVIIMQAPGINDLVYDSLTSRNNYPATLDNLRFIFDTFRSRGIQMIIGTITPVATGEARAIKSVMQMAQRVNDYIWNYSRRYGGMLVVDPYSVVINPTNATGLAKAGYLASADNIHYNNIGAYRVAKSMRTAVAAAFPSQRSTLPMSALNSQAATALTTPTGVAANNVVTISATASNVEKGQEVFIRGATGSYVPLNGMHVALGTDSSGSFRILSPSNVPDGAVSGTLVVSLSRQLFPDPLLQTATGGDVLNGLSGVAAGQFRITNNAGNTGTLTAVGSVASAISGFGNEQLITITAAAVNDIPRIALKNSVGTIENKMVAGRTYVFEAMLRVSSTDWSATPLSEVFFSMDITANGSSENWSINQVQGYETALPIEASGSESLSLHLKTPPLTIPANMTSLDSCQCDVRLRYQGAQSSGTLVMGVSQFAVNDVTPDYQGQAIF